MTPRGDTPGTPRPAPAIGDQEPASPPARPPPRRWRSTELLGSATEIEIEHGAAVYRLRTTSLGKLILTK